MMTTDFVPEFRNMLALESMRVSLEYRETVSACMGFVNKFSFSLINSLKFFKQIKIIFRVQLEQKCEARVRSVTSKLMSKRGFWLKFQ